MLVLVNTIGDSKLFLRSWKIQNSGAVLMSIGLFWTFCVVCFCCYPKDFDDPRMRFSSENCIPICETVQFINGELNLDCRLRRSVTKIWKFEISIPSTKNDGFNAVLLKKSETIFLSGKYFFKFYWEWSIRYECNLRFY